MKKRKVPLRHILNDDGKTVRCGGLFGRELKANGTELKGEEVWDKLGDDVCRKCMDSFVNQQIKDQKNETEKQTGKAHNEKTAVCKKAQKPAPPRPKARSKKAKPARGPRRANGKRPKSKK